jgi:hypothetical protein
MDKISKDKQYTTRDGRPYRCYATDGGGAYPVHGAVFKGGEWWPVRHTETGRFNEAEKHGYDLIEFKPRKKIERWIMVERHDACSMWITKPSQVETVNSFAVKHIVFEVEEGEGLDEV